MNNTPIAARVRKMLRRQKPRRTQGWLANELGISTSYLSMILSGNRCPSLRVAVRLEEVTGVKMRDFADAAKEQQVA